MHSYCIIGYFYIRNLYPLGYCKNKKMGSSTNIFRWWKWSATAGYFLTHKKLYTWKLKIYLHFKITCPPSQGISSFFIIPQIPGDFPEEQIIFPWLFNVLKYINQRQTQRKQYYFTGFFILFTGRMYCILITPFKFL